MLVDAPADHPEVPFADVSLLASGDARRFYGRSTRSNACYYGADLAALPDDETDGAHVDGRGNTGCTDSITSPS